MTNSSDQGGAAVPGAVPIAARFDPERWAREFGVDVAVAVSELPDRTSPDDWPEAMLVTASELSAIIEPRILPELETAFESGKEEGVDLFRFGPEYTARHHRVIMASVSLGKWMSAALDDANVCEEMKADIREWFSAGEPVLNWNASATEARRAETPQSDSVHDGAVGASPDARKGPA